MTDRHSEPQPDDSPEDDAEDEVVDARLSDWWGKRLAGLFRRSPDE